MVPILNMIPGKYSLNARFLPAAFSMLFPILIFSHFYLSHELENFIKSIITIKICAYLTVPAIFIYFFSEVGRFIGKNLFEKWYFKDQLHMPTTTFLLYKDSNYSEEFKEKFHKKVAKDFGFNLIDKINEANNEHLARIKIVEVMALIRKKLHDNQFLLQHNIEYGMMRNTIGGALIGLILSGANIYFFKIISFSPLAVYLSYAFFALYGVLVILSKVVIVFYGKSYARILYREYIG